MTDQWTDLLSDYLDDELTPAERLEIEAHLQGCRDCAATLDELRSVIARAEQLGDVMPERDLWPAIAARVADTPQETVWWEKLRARLWRDGRVSLSVPQLAGVAAALVIATAATVVMSRGGAAPGLGAGTSDPRSEVTLANFADPQYDAAVADLKRALEAGRGRLDQQTVAILERNLSIIDGAIAQARQALSADPSNAYLNSYLAEARRRKLELLRQVTGLAGLAS